MRTSWCGQVAAPKARQRSAFSRRLAASPSAPPITKAAAGRPASRQPCSAPVKAALPRLSPRSSRTTRAAPSGNKLGERDRFLGHAPAGLAGAALGDLDHFDAAYAHGAAGLGGALAVALGKVAFRPALEPAHGGHDQSHLLRAFRPSGNPPAAGGKAVSRAGARLPPGAHIFSRL